MHFIIIDATLSVIYVVALKEHTGPKKPNQG